MSEKHIRLENIHRDLIDVGVRARIDYGVLDDLVGDIKDNGLIQPLAVLDKSKSTQLEELAEELNESKPFLLLGGGRRFEATKRAGLDILPCRVFERDMSADEVKIIELHENLYRKDLDFKEEVKLKKRIHDLQVKLKGEKIGRSLDSEGHSLRDTASMLGQSSSTLSRDLQLARMIELDPDLANSKNKSEALKKLEKIKRGMALDELEKRRKAKEESTNTGFENAWEAKRKKVDDSYIIGDFFKHVADLPDGAFDFVEVDPPYGVDLKSRKKQGTVTTSDYNEVDMKEYGTFMKNTLRECYRVMKPNSWIIIWFGPEPWFHLMSEWMRDAGFQFARIPGIWSKGTGQTMQPQYYMGNSYEMFFYARKGNPGLIKQGRANVFNYRPVPAQKKIHPTERPVEMMREILDVFCPTHGSVLVPFAGSGNTLLAAANRFTPAVGYDLADTYKKEFSFRVYQEIPTQYRSYEKGRPAEEYKTDYEESE